MPAKGSCSLQKQGSAPVWIGRSRDKVQSNHLSTRYRGILWADSHMSALMRHQLAVPVPLPRQQPLLVVGADGGPAFVGITSPPSFPTAPILPHTKLEVKIEFVKSLMILEKEMHDFSVFELSISILNNACNLCTY
ncbi:hypothetical protein SLA2020_296860 [Shorea laevis]